MNFFEQNLHIIESILSSIATHCFPFLLARYFPAVYVANFALKGVEELWRK
jgi:hypothetical protein